MARILGVDNARLYSVGRFNPPKHRGIDVFAPPGSNVYVPVGWKINITWSYAVNNNWGQCGGWATICGKRYGYVAAHFRASATPKKGWYEAGDYLGDVAGHVNFTPHIHFGLNPDKQPPPGTVAPLSVWRECLESITGGSAVLLIEEPEEEIILHVNNRNDEEDDKE